MLDFYRAAILDWDFEAASGFLGADYIQHSPGVGDGLAGLKAFIEGVPAPVKASLKTEIRRVLVDGDMVAVHTLNTMPGLSRVIVDFFRVENDKVVEHWDVVQDVPPTAAHDNPMA